MNGRTKIRVLHLVAKWGRADDLINEYVAGLDPQKFDSILCSLSDGPPEGSQDTL